MGEPVLTPGVAGEWLTKPGTGPMLAPLSGATRPVYPRQPAFASVMFAR